MSTNGPPQMSTGGSILPRDNDRIAPVAAAEEDADEDETTLKDRLTSHSLVMVRR